MQDCGRGSNLAVLLFVDPACLFYWGIGRVGKIETIGRQVSVQAKRKLYFRESYLKMKGESFDGTINKKN